MNINDRLFGVLMLALAVAYGWGATQIPVPFGGSEAVGPSTFPLILSVVLGLCSVYIIVRPDPDKAWPVGRSLLELLLAVVALVAYTLLLEPLGFIAATALVVGTLSFRLGVRPVRAYVTGLVCGGVIFLMFTFGLGLPLPIGFGG